MMGKMTIFKMSNIIDQKLISMSCPANNFINAGVKSGAKSVAHDVIAMDKGTFAFAMYAITLEAKPLGEQPINKIPAEISGGKSKEYANTKPTNGMMVNWHIKPTKTALGVFTTATKSAHDIVVPMPNIMICSKGTMSNFSLKPLISRKY